MGLRAPPWRYLFSLVGFRVISVATTLPWHHLALGSSPSSAIIHLSDLEHVAVSFGTSSSASLKSTNNKCFIVLPWGPNKHLIDGNLNIHTIYMYHILLAPLQCLPWWNEVKNLLQGGLAKEEKLKDPNGRGSFTVPFLCLWISDPQT